MIYPSIDEITKGKYNRYTLVIATAKCAREVTDEYVEERTRAEKLLAENASAGKNIASLLKREIRDEKAVKTAIKRLYSGEYAITEGPEEVDERLRREAAEKEAEEIKKEAEAAKLSAMLKSMELDENASGENAQGEEDAAQDGEDAETEEKENTEEDGNGSASDFVQNSEDGENY